MSFNGNTSDAQRNTAQVQLADSIGNMGTRPRSIDLAIQIENGVFEKSRNKVNAHYNEHIQKLVGLLKNGGQGMQLQQQLLAGMTRPSTFVDNNVKKMKKAKKDKKQEKKKEVKARTADDYYFFKSTDPETAKNFRPKLLDQPQTSAPRQIVARPQQVQKTQTNISAAPSAWNTGGTWEERNLTPFTHRRIKELLAENFSPQFVSGPLQVEIKEWKVEGDASLVLVRGKKRLGYELNFNGEFKGTFQDEKVEGKIIVPSVDLQESTDQDF